MGIYTYSQNLTSSNFGLISWKFAEMKAKFKIQLDVCDIASLKDEYLMFCKLISLYIVFVQSASDRVCKWSLMLFKLLLVYFSTSI